MTLNHTNSFRGSLRQRGREIRSLRAAHCHIWLYAMALALLIAVACAIPIGAQGNPSVEYQVKAAFLYNFVKFVEWPPDAFQGEKSPITLCLFRYDPFGSALDEVIAGQTLNNRRLVVQRINKLPDLKPCQLVFVSDREDKHLPEILNSLEGASALVVGEGEDFAEHRGGIQFFLENKKLRFAVNVDAIQRARLRVSSKLLALARIVHDEGHPKGA
jgi:YfiR/HmsC-like